jgi:hypothetical protein
MAVHKHMLHVDGNWFSCEGCGVRLEVVPFVEPSPGVLW